MIGAALCAVLATGCVGSGDVATRLSGQIVGIDGKFLGPGMAMFELGRVHEGSYKRGALIDEDGRFTVELPEGGTWGIHLFKDGYQYLPLEVTIGTHQQVILTSMMVQWGIWMDLTGQPTWPDQPTDQTLIGLPFDDLEADNPVLHDVEITWTDDYLSVTAEVSDPDGDLSNMILLHDPATGGGYALGPPSAPNAKGEYPDGTYKLLIPRDERHVPEEGVMYLVVSDILCNDTDIWIEPLPALP